MARKKRASKASKGKAAKARVLRRTMKAKPRAGRSRGKKTYRR